ncbi:putative carbonic anhydrase 3 isoform X2 [Cylas formicarius]|uniref:putative carbonic anhydrase 3 isoform X2 n=1 Tax=Cylas formicarius TaxID=197179 RepID=UPI002958AD56|nr:putative carbonic anhydrase 3 isoform X2 [Cylas formicarius]
MPVVCASCLIVMVICGVGQFVSASDWKYGNEGAWPELCQSGSRQSPIGLSPSIAMWKNFSRLIMEGYGQRTVAVMKNNGHSAEVRLKHVQNPKVHGGGLPGFYELDHLHFHWQSEHTVDDIRFPLELHLVHHIKGMEMTEAVEHPNGVAVFAVMLEISPDDEEDFEPLLDILDNLKDTVGEVRQLTDFSVKDFLPKDKAGFYRYEGSLTTPNCNEGVIWTVFTNTLRISRSQVKKFEQIKTTEKSPLTQNFRGIQPLNGRAVYLKRSPVMDSSARGVVPSAWLAVSLVYVGLRW